MPRGSQRGDTPADRHLAQVENGRKEGRKERRHLWPTDATALEVVDADAAGLGRTDGRCEVSRKREGNWGEGKKGTFSKLE